VENNLFFFSPCGHVVVEGGRVNDPVSVYEPVPGQEGLVHGVVDVAGLNQKLVGLE
jgi:hypothetical protein